MADPSSPRPGMIRRLWRALIAPSARWSVLSLVALGIVVGAAGIIATNTAVEATGTVEFCGGACHSMHAFTLPEYQQSVHGVNPFGVTAACSDCHIPHAYPQKLWYKARAGIHDMIAEARGVIATPELYEKERWRLANEVWAEMRANDSANCRSCHHITADTIAKQNRAAQMMHKRVLEKKSTCIDCHKGVAHKVPEEPAAPATTGALR